MKIKKPDLDKFKTWTDKHKEEIKFVAYYSLGVAVSAGCFYVSNSGKDWLWVPKGDLDKLSDGVYSVIRFKDKTHDFILVNRPTLTQA